MARTGGILTFIMIGAVVIAVLLSLVSQQVPALGVVALVLNLVAFVLWFVVMIALKVNLDRNGFHRAGGPIWLIIILTVVIIALCIVAAVVAGTEIARRGNAGADPAVFLRGLGAWAIAICAIALCVQFCLLMLGTRLNEYSATNGGIWKGTGVVLIVSACLGLATLGFYIVMIFTQLWGIAIIAGILGFVGLLVYGAFWILLGVAFMSDAGRMVSRPDRMPAAGTVRR